jgi:hypothetical protein
MNDDTSRREFLARQSSDPEFAEAVASARSMADAIAIAATYGIDVSPETIRWPWPQPQAEDDERDEGSAERGPTF